MGDTAGSGRVRLHIAPFNQELLDRFIPASVRPSATDISFHTLETFPERGFGYVELPKPEADKLKKKLNGMTLKGTKVKIEEARPMKKRKTDAEENDEERKERKKAKKEKKKKEQGVLEGHELEGRHVKRGWEDKNADKKAVKKDKRNKLKSKEDKVERRNLKFKTEIPPNALPVEKGKEKKEKKEKPEKTRKVVKEFENTRKLRPVADQKPGKEAVYEEGRGWVDEDGEVLEEEPPSVVRKRRSKAEAAERRQARAAARANGEILSDSSDYSDSEMSSEDPSSDEDDSEESQDETPTASVQTPGKKVPLNDVAKEVHPLEALFKRAAATSPDSSKSKPAPIETSFSFFQSGEDEDEDEPMGEPVNMPPQTPHTQRDLEWRNLRSGAPTPDTAAIGKRFDFPFNKDDEDDDEDDDDVAEPDTPVAKGASSKASAPEVERDESEFRKWFYENRGDLNRGWKKRRREERKSKRQRDNRVLSRKVV